jgi:predicted O-methyltransferase YrrM
MFHSIPEPIKQRMRYLEKIDAQDRIDGTPRMQRMRQVPPETGKFVAMLAASAPDGNSLEIGTSAGYSTLWLALACRQLGRKITTYEILEEKARLAAETFKLTRVEETVELVKGDALEYLPRIKDISFCFLDAEKEIYGACYEAVIPNMVSGGLLVADNAINFREVLQPMISRSLNDDRVDALVVPIGTGVLICRKI